MDEENGREKEKERDGNKKRNDKIKMVNCKLKSLKNNKIKIKLLYK